MNNECHNVGTNLRSAWYHPNFSEICKLIPGFKFLDPIYFETSVADRHHDFFGTDYHSAKNSEFIHLFPEKAFGISFWCQQVWSHKRTHKRSSCTLLVQRSIFGSIFSSERSRTLCSTASHIIPRLPVRYYIKYPYDDSLRWVSMVIAQRSTRKWVTVLPHGAKNLFQIDHESTAVRTPKWSGSSLSKAVWAGSYYANAWEGLRGCHMLLRTAGSMANICSQLANEDVSTANKRWCGARSPRNSVTVVHLLKCTHSYYSRYWSIWSGRLEFTIPFDPTFWESECFPLHSLNSVSNSSMCFYEVPTVRAVHVNPHWWWIDGRDHASAVRIEVPH